MLAVRAHRYGAPDALVVEHLPEPEPGPGQVLVAVHAAAVNFPDVLILAGRYQVSWPLPLVPGSEFAGVVQRIGDGVRGFAPGDRVYGSIGVGAFAERLVAPADRLALVPAGVPMREAAAFRVAHGTAYHVVRTVAGVQPGDWIVVLGAAGGVGLAAVDVARLLGVRVLAAVSTAEKAEVCRARGADAVVDYTVEDLKARVKDLTGGGAHAVVDPVGGSNAEAALRALRPGGRFVCVGFASGEIPRIPLNLVLVKRVTVTGFEARTFPQDHPEAARRGTEELHEHLAAGRLRPRVSAVFPLERAREALELVAARQVTGKAVVETAAARG